MTEKELTKDVYSQVTTRIIADLEAGVRSWIKPWRVGGSSAIPLRENGTPYQGINILMLWSEAISRGYSSAFWMTYNQAQKLGGQVRKGERSAMVVFAKRITAPETTPTGEETERQIHLLRHYSVFNVEQIDGLPSRYYTPAATPLPLSERIEAVDAFIRATGATIEHRGDRAFYAPFLDLIRMPPFETFTDKESYYATILHEILHWTRHKSRLNRDFGSETRGDEGYAKEELVAELGAAFLCAELGITPEIREDHAAYIGHWIAILNHDKRAIFRAAAHAQRAADYLKSLQPKPPEPELAGMPGFPARPTSVQSGIAPD